MSLLRSGASKKYSDNWAAAFGESRVKKKNASKTGARSKKPKSKSGKKASGK